MKEKDIQNEIRLALNDSCVTFRANVGKFMTKDGRIISTGLPVGFSDLFGIRKMDGRAFFIEVKNEKGRVRPEQAKFLDEMKKYHAIVGVARTATEAVNIINENQ